ncbi:MAG: response regulator [Nitrospinae bacterium]|nr:response regulator [Nitrospinota bacterium]
MENDGYILIVEDSPTQASQIGEILRQTGYPVSIACNAQDALTRLREQKAIIVVTDILMPEIDGYQLCKIIKSDDNLKEIPVILLTRLSDPREVIRGLECGADNFIVKSSKEEFLIKHVQEMLTVKQGEAIPHREANILVVEDSPTQAEQLKYLLEESGYKVHLAFNGIEGLAAARRFNPNIIISDIFMPLMDGYKMAYEIKHDERLKKIPIILVTSLKDREGDFDKVSDIADGYFIKPFDDKSLIDKINSLLSISGYRENDSVKGELETTFEGEHYRITANKRQILNFLLSAYESSIQKNHELIQIQYDLKTLNEQLEERVMERTRQLEESEENFRALAENANDGIGVTMGVNGDIVYANKRLSEITGYAIDELHGKSFKELVVSEKLPVDTELYRQILEGMLISKQRETAIRQKGGNILPIELTASRTLWRGNPAVITIIRDITERKKREEEFIRTTKIETLCIIAGGIVHDLNNIMTSVTGNAYLTKKFLKPEDKAYEFLGNIEKASLRANDLTQKLLTFTKDKSPIKKVLSLSNLIRDSISLTLSGSHIKCDFFMTDDLYPLEVDEGQMGQVFDNLIINAKQAMPEGGMLRVSAENISLGVETDLPLKYGRYVKIFIQDTGVGISEENIKKIFDPYFTTKEKGSGLGLATVYSIIKNHNGYISVESEVGVGTTFSIYLPVYENLQTREKGKEML